MADVDAFHGAVEKRHFHRAVEGLRHGRGLGAFRGDLCLQVGGAGDGRFAQHVLQQRAGLHVLDRFIEGDLRRVAAHVHADVAAVAAVVEIGLQRVQAQLAVLGLGDQQDVGQARIGGLELADAEAAVHVQRAQRLQRQAGGLHRGAGGHRRGGRVGLRRQVAVHVDAVDGEIEADGGLREVAHRGVAGELCIVGAQFELLQFDGVQRAVEVQRQAGRVEHLRVAGLRQRDIGAGGQLAGGEFRHAQAAAGLRGVDDPRGVDVAVDLQAGGLELQAFDRRGLPVEIPRRLSSQ